VLDIFSVTVAIIGLVAAIITVITGLYVFKKPHLSFILDKANFSLTNEAREKADISLLYALVSNKKKQFLGDVAKSVTACLFYRSEPVSEKSMGLDSSIGLPWLENFTVTNKISEKLTSQEDIMNALEKHLFERKETNIPQGRGRGLAVALGIKKNNRMFFASNPPIEITLPSPNQPQVAFHAVFMNLEIAGENLASKQEAGTMLMVKNWNEWTIPTKVETLLTPSNWKNMLLNFGIGRKQKVIKVETEESNKA
jgi:hypothetical protein